jgi:solute carrier family 25 folate transporter 32
MRDQLKSEKYKKVKIELLSGINGAMISTILLQPLDIARNRYSVQKYEVKKYDGFVNTFKTIIEEEGIKGLYTGLKISMLTTPIYYALFFSFY